MKKLIFILSCVLSFSLAGSAIAVVQSSPAPKGYQKLAPYKRAAVLYNLPKKDKHKPVVIKKNGKVVAVVDPKHGNKKAVVDVKKGDKPGLTHLLEKQGKLKKKNIKVQ